MRTAERTGSPPVPGRPATYFDDDVHLWSASLDVSAARQRELADLLSDDERERAARFRFRDDRRFFVAARGQLRALLGGYAGREPRAVTFAYGAQGKPGLVDVSDDLRFNLSHSGALVLYAITIGREIGVDLERIRPIPEMADIVDRWFPERERRWFHTRPPGTRRRAFFVLWTRREALVKARGLGIAAIGDVVPGRVDPVAGLAEGGVAAAPLTAEGWTVSTVEPAPGYIASVAVERGPVRLLHRPWTGRWPAP